MTDTTTDTITTDTIIDENTVKKTLQELCCCDTAPVKNCGPECCIQLPCAMCNKIVRICKDGWKKIGESSLLCIKCLNSLDVKYD